MNSKKGQELANFRYQLIAPIVTRTKLSRGEVKAHIENAAEKEYQMPDGTRKKVSPRTIERYLKKYRDGGWEALKPRKRSSGSRVPEEYIEAAILLKKENPSRSINQIISTLELAKKVPKGTLKRSTLYDHFKKHNLTGRFDRKEYKAYQRYEARYRCQKWQGDTCQLLKIPDANNPGKNKKVHLVTWLDDYSRLVTHAQCYFDEKLPSLEDSLKKAIIKYGKPEILYADNGKIYSSNHLQSICGKLGIYKTHSRPYKPQGRGKIERFFSTVKSSFLPELMLLLENQKLSLSQINSYLDAWITHHYHKQIHSSTKQKPVDRFENNTEPIQNVPLEKLYDAFLLEETRSVDKTGVISLNNIRYQADLGLARKKVLIRYDPYSPEKLQVYCENNRFPDAKVLEIPEHVDFKKSKEDEKPPETPKTGLNYLDLLQNNNQSFGLQFQTPEDEEEKQQ